MTNSTQSALEAPKKKISKISKRDKNLINLLFLLGIVFSVTNLPIAIARIFLAFGFKNEQYFRQFIVLSNILEVFFAASNFYLYCLFNVQVRQKVKIIDKKHMIQVNFLFRLQPI